VKLDSGVEVQLVRKITHFIALQRTLENTEKVYRIIHFFLR